MPFATHPGSLLRRELKARELSANRLALDLGVRRAVLPTFSMDAARSLQIRPSGSADILEIVPNSGLICRASTTLLSSSVNAAPRSRGVCDLRMRRESAVAA